MVNVVTGYGGEAGAALVEPIAASRSSPSRAARPPAARSPSPAREQLKKCHLELGGNDPFIVDEGVDLDVAARGAAWACYLNMGQVCTSAERFYVLDSVFDEFVDRFAAFTKTLRIGDPLGPDVDLGPMVSAAQREKLEKKVAEAVKGGAKLVAGGRRPERFDKGFFYEPTALVDVPPGHGPAARGDVRPGGAARALQATSTRRSTWPTAASTAWAPRSTRTASSTR